MVLKYVKRDLQNEVSLIRQWTINALIPIRYISQLEKGTKRFLEKKSIKFIEHLANLSKSEILLYPMPHASAILPVWEKIQSKMYLKKEEYRVIKYLHSNNVRITKRQHGIIMAISAFSPLFKENDLRKMLGELLPELYNENYMRIRDKSKGKKIIEGFKNNTSFTKTKAA